MKTAVVLSAYLVCKKMCFFYISTAVTMRGSYVPVRDSSVAQYSPHSLKCIADMEIKPNDLFDFNVIKFVWFRYGEQLQVIEEDTRVTINPKTGT